MARQYPYDTSPEALFFPTKNKVASDFFQDWTDQDQVNTALMSAELSRLVYGEKPLVEAALPAAELQLLPGGWFGGAGLAERWATRGTDGFVAEAKNGSGITYVVFRGTESRLEDLLSDLNAFQTGWKDLHDKSSGRVHQGFLKAYETIRPELARLLAGRQGRIVFTGHSLGAAIATLAAADHLDKAAELYTYGSPRVGDEAFVSQLGGLRASQRRVNCCDIVARVPVAELTRENIQEIIAAFRGEHAINAGIAAVLHVFLEVIAGGRHYSHLETLHYHDHTGQAVPGATPAFIADDQRKACAAYGVGPAPEMKIGDLNSLRTFIGACLALATGAKVPYRALTDHAPINYLSALTGRCQA